MFRNLRSILSGVYTFLCKPKSWRWPRKAEVLLIDAAGKAEFAACISPHAMEVVYSIDEQVNVFAAFSCIFGKGTLAENYLDFFIRRVAPRLIVTFIDNSHVFYSISLRHPSVRTLFAQNGLRDYRCFEALQKERDRLGQLRVDSMLVFGRCIGSMYSASAEGTIFPVGCLMNNHVPKFQTANKCQIIFISQYRNFDRVSFYSRFVTFSEFYAAEQLVLPYLQEYARRTGKSLSVVMAGSSDSEREFFNALLGDECDLQEKENAYSSYEAIDRADVVVTIDSALGYESAARGNKTALFTVRSTLCGLEGNRYGWPGHLGDKGPFWTDIPDPEVFGQILDRLFSLSEEGWPTVLKASGFPDIMSFDPGNTVLRGLIKQELGPHSRIIA